MKSFAFFNGHGRLFVNVQQVATNMSLYFFHSNYNLVDAQKFKVHIHLTMYIFITYSFYLPSIMVNHMHFFLLCICYNGSCGWRLVGDM